MNVSTGFLKRHLKHVEGKYNSKGLLVIDSYRMKAKCTGTVTYGIPLAIRVAYAQVLVVFFLEEIANKVCEKNFMSKPYKIKGNNSLDNIKNVRTQLGMKGVLAS